MPSETAGFTRLELLATATVVVLLALVCWPALAQTRVDSQNLACLRNLRLLSQGWQMYADDNGGRLPANGGVNPCWVGSPVETIPPALPYNTDRAALLDPRFSSMGPYTRDAGLYRCPADGSTVWWNGFMLPRVRSYSMNAALGTTTSPWLPSPTYRVYQRQADLGSPPPEQHWVFIDAHPESINSGAFAVAMADSPSRTQLVDYPAAWHDGGAGIAFADGRAEIHRWVDARTKPTQIPTFVLASPNNPDVLWLARRTSSKAP